uniref:Retrotransposon gag domain-containing protein n=1 Tax=Tanacetum cinerariifolium TaxID=118510 RepID=A0A6L2NS76_TANCI|nr:hypothetical protein [Tanacetum cinerariifolium]
MADNFTMTELLRAPIEGYAEAIVVPPILAEQFELKHSLINMITSDQFFRLEKDNLHDHIRWFNKITSTIKYRDVPNEAIKLILFPFSLAGAACRTTSLRNEISNFEQKFDESFHEAWDRYKDLLRACSHHGFTELHQLNTFYNALNPTDQDSLNAAGGNLLERSTQDVLTLIKNKSKALSSRSKSIASQVKACNTNSSSEIAELTHAVNEQTSAMTTTMTAMLKKFQAIPPPALVKAVEETCVTCRDAHSYYQCLAAGANTFLEFRDNIQGYLSASVVNYNQGNLGYHSQGVANEIRPPAITTRSGVSYDGPSISPPVVENAPKAIKDTVVPTNNGTTEDFQPQAVPSKSPVSTSEPANTPVSASKPNPQALIPCPSRRNDERNQEKAKDQIEKFYQIFKDMSFEISFTDALILMPKFASTLKALIGNKETLSEMARTPLNEHCSAVLLKKLPKKLGDLTLRVGKEAITFNLDQTSRYSANYNDMTAKRIDVIDMACEEYSQEVLRFSDTVSSGNPTPFYDPIVSATSLTLTPFRESDFFLEEVDAFLAIEDEPILSLPQSYLDPKRDILLLEAFLNDDPSPPPPNQRDYMPEVRKELKICEAKFDKSSVDEPPVVELKALPLHLEYAFLEGEDKLPVIIAKDLSVVEKAALIMVLKSHERAIAWKLSDIKGINPEFCNHKILLEEDFTPAVQHQRQVNPKIYNVIKIKKRPHSPVHMGRSLIAACLLGYEMLPERFKDSFQSCLSYLEKMLKRYEDTNLCLNLEKSHFMVKEGIVLGHKISKKGIELDKAKIDVISKLPNPTTVKGIISFLGHAGFYRRFIKEFSKIARPMTRLLEKDTPFVFS